MKVLHKLVEDGNVAVVISPDYGSGWYSWNVEYPEILFDPGIVKLVLDKKFDELVTYVTLKYPDVHQLSIDNLVVEWVPQGREFRVNEYDGKEWIEFKDELDWITA